MKHALAALHLQFTIAAVNIAASLCAIAIVGTFNITAVALWVAIVLAWAVVVRTQQG